MATGGGGGFSHKLGEAFVDLFVRDARLKAGVANAQKLVNGIKAAGVRAGGAGPARAQAQADRQAFRERMKAANAEIALLKSVDKLRAKLAREAARSDRARRTMANFSAHGPSSAQLRKWQAAASKGAVHGPSGDQLHAWQRRADRKAAREQAAEAARAAKRQARDATAAMHGPTGDQLYKWQARARAQMIRNQEQAQRKADRQQAAAARDAARAADASRKKATADALADARRMAAATRVANRYAAQDARAKAQAAAAATRAQAQADATRRRYMAQHQANLNAGYNARMFGKEPGGGLGRWVMQGGAKRVRKGRRMVARGRASGNSGLIGAGLKLERSGMGLVRAGNALARAGSAIGRPVAGLIRAGSAIGRAGGNLVQGAFAARRMMAGFQRWAGTQLGVDLNLAGVVKEAADMEQRMLGLRRVTDLEGQALEDLGDRFKKAAGLTGGRDLASTFKVADIGARMGIGGDSLALFTRDMVKVGAVLDENVIPFEELTTRISRLSSVFRLGSQDAIRIASALNRLDMSSSANAREILDVTNRMSGMAAVFKLSVTQTMALATALKQANIPTESAGTSMSQLLGRMAESKSRKSFAKIAGMGEPAWKKLVSTDALGAVKAMVRGLNELEARKGPIAVVDSLNTLRLDGQRVRGTLLQLGQVIEKVDEYAAAAGEDFRTQSSILEGFKVVMESMNKQYELMQNNVRLAAAAVGAGLLPIFKSAIRAIIGLANDVQSFFEGNKAAVTAWAAAVGDKIEYVGSVFRSWRDHLQLAKLFGMEKAEQGWEILTRFISQLSAHWSATWDNMKAGAMNALGEVGRFLGNLFTQVITRLSAQLHNLIADLPAFMGGGGKKQAVPDIDPANVMVKPNAFKKGDFFDAAHMQKGMREVPGFDFDKVLGRGAARVGPHRPGDVLPLPDRRDEMAPVLARIKQARDDMRRERAQAAQLEEIRDAVQREKIRVAGLEKRRAQLDALREQAALMRPGKGRRGAVAAFHAFGREAGFGAWELGVPARMEAIQARNRRRRAARTGPGGKGDARDDAWRLMAPPRAAPLAPRGLPVSPAMARARALLAKVRVDAGGDFASGPLAAAEANAARFRRASGMPAAQARIAAIGDLRRGERARRMGRLAVQDPGGLARGVGAGLLGSLKGMAGGFAGLGNLIPKAKPDPDAKEKKNAGFIGEAVAKATGLDGGKLVEALNKLMAMAAAPPVWGP